MSSASSFRLELFGNRSVVGADGIALTGQAVQRHRMALLALLALAGGKSLSREKLMGYLWPDRDAEHARQLLNQAVYNLRKALADEAILSDGEDLRLNPNVVRADVADFEAALAGGNYAEAVRLYSGPFLDAFSLGDTPEFEWWADRERRRLATEHALALEALAEAATRDGNLLRAVEWWTARAALDPYDSRVAVRLMEALDASGNRAGALRHARVHERLLKAEFDAPPSPEASAVAERLRSAVADRESSSVHASEHAPEERDRDAPSVARATGSTSPTVAEARGDPMALSPAPDVPSWNGAVAALSRTRRVRAIGYTVVGVALAVTGFVAIGYRLNRHDALAAAPPPTSIAVLPLANLSPDVHDAFLADGMTEELIGRLAKRGGLRVIASTSVFAFRDQPLDARRIGDSLHVAHLVEGDVQKSGSRLRVRVRLIDARDGETRWSESYDRELRDVLAVEDDIARAVVGQLGLHLDAVAAPSSNPHQTRNVAAYELYLRGNNSLLLRSDSGTQSALGYFQQAVTLDSSYAAAYAGLSRIYLRQGLSGTSESRRARVTLAEQNAAKALALDDSVADAHAAFALVERAKFDLGPAASHLERAIELEPAREAFHEWLASLYVLAGRPADALREAQRALDLDPLSPGANAELARALLANGRADEALVQLQKVAALRPPLLRSNIIAAECYMKKGMWPEAIAVLRAQADRGGPIALAHLGFALARSGQKEAALGIRDTLVQRWRRDRGGPLEVALVSAGLGERDQAFVWLDRAIAAGSLDSEGARLLFDELRGDPRFARIRERQRLQN